MVDALSGLKTALADRYQLERELGHGGMATVYLAHDLKHDRKVAVKVLRPELAAVIGAERFLAEIKTTANLQHPHILGLFDSGQVDGTVFYVMPFVDGESLRDRLTREKQLPIEDAVRISREVADALQYAHAQGVIHRDIKPENILLHGGHALVADFGIALAAATTAGTRMTETGMSLGTPTYMSPEQAMGERNLDARTDIYALGCVTYEALVGEPPFTGPTAQAIVAKVMTATPESLTTLRRTVPPAVARAVHRAIEKLPADRFPTAAAFGAALSGEGGTHSWPAEPVAQRAAPGRRWPLALVALLVASAAYGIGRRSGSAVAGPSVFDAALPDTAPMSFAASTSTSSYGVPLRNLSVAPSGEFAVYTARQGDSTMLWYRSLRDATVHPITGTRGATAPRISPDGQQIAFLRGDRVMLVPLGGGEARMLLDANSTALLQWSSANQVITSDADGNRFSWLDPGGGAPRSKPIPRCSFGENVPGTSLLICSYNRSALVIDPDSGTRWAIRSARPDGKAGSLLAGSAFRVVDQHYLVYLAVDGTLTAARYDPATRLAGRAVSLLGGLRREGIGEGQFDFTTDGSLLFAPGVDATIGRIVSLKPGGTPQLLPVEGADFQRYDLSRDRRWLAASVQGPEANELRIYDLRDGQHFSWIRGELVRHPLWSADGEQLLFAVRDSTRWSILRGAPSSGARPDTVASMAYDPGNPDPTDWHDDHLAVGQDWGSSIATRFDPGAAHPSFDTVLTGARFASLSPNGKL
ncbi:MAG: protein kinase, partial [Gemmatimonadota bacterium]